jgi:predicted metalloprotease with PDZ domain
VSGTTADKTADKPYLGAELAQEDDRLMVKEVYAGSPAYEQGLNTGDQILAVNNIRATKAIFDARVAEKRPGDLIALTIFRFDDLSTLPIKLGQAVEPYRLAPVDKPTESQKQTLRSWLGVNSP